MATGHKPSCPHRDVPQPKADPNATTPSMSLSALGACPECWRTETGRFLILGADGFIWADESKGGYLR